MVISIVAATRLGLAESSAETLEQAKALFREGNALLGAGDPERALERFLQSRAVVPSGKNTANAAICLERLGRNDEALEMYEELLARFAADLDPQDRENIAPIMASLRRGLGSLDISANVEGLITVDGRPRGRLPRVTGLRAVAGRRRVRVVMEGYASFDQTVDVVAGETLSLDASLEPLSGMGAVRVELTGGATGAVIIDSRRVGAAPWEGTLRSGTHVLQVVGEVQGSKPETLQVLERKTLLVRASGRQLGPNWRITTVPPSATLSLDGVPLGRGSWTGRLPIGAYQLRVEENGYFPQATALVVQRAAAGESRIIALRPDPDHPRWPHPNPWHLGVALSGAFEYAPSLNGGQESACPGLCAGSTSALGGRVEAALDLLHEVGFGVELGLGYLVARQSFERAAVAVSGDIPVTYALAHEMVLGGGYARAAGVWRRPLPKAFGLRAALGLGLINAAYEARSEGVAWTIGDPVSVNGSGYQPIGELLPVVTGAASVEHALGPIAIALGISAWFAPTSGPKFPNVELAVTPDCTRTKPQAVGCARSSDLLSSESVHGAFMILSPELTARYRF